MSERRQNEASQGTRLESWNITPTCRAKGDDTAWNEAVANLKAVYDAQLAHEYRGGFEGQITLTVSIARSVTLENGERVE